MKKLSSLLIGVIALFSLTVQAQGELPVNMYTGTPFITVPIGAVSAPGISDNINLSYNTGGVPVGAESGYYGVNWSLDAGGSISREVRGLPDDFLRTTAPVRKGWLHQRASGARIAAEVATFTNSSDTNTACPATDEAADFAKLESLNDSIDSEPDLFSYSVGGYSGKFVFDNSTTPQIRMIPYQDILIEPTFAVEPQKTILSFTITTSTGVKYFFNVCATEARRIRLSFPENDIWVNEKNQYKSSSLQQSITYTTQWQLNQAQSPAGGQINYEYDAHITTPQRPVKVRIRNHEQSVFVDSLTITSRNLFKISTPGGISYSIAKNDSMIYSIQLRDARKGSAVIKQFNLTYLYVSKKSYLKTVQEVSATDSIPPYRFDYCGYIPAADTKAIDFWGYYNGKTSNVDLYPALYIYQNLAPNERVRLHPITGMSPTIIIPGADRSAHPDMVKAGSICAIRYPHGGFTSIEYESNDYYDSIALQNYLGGGVRIKSTAYIDGTNREAVITKNYTYKNTTYPARSSGVLISKPIFAIPLAKLFYNGAELTMEPGDPLEWDLFTARTDADLSPAQNRPIGYKEVKVFRPGAGHAHHIYALPALPYVTQNKLARPGTTPCPSAGILKYWGTHVFPFAPQIEYDYARGLPLFKYDYDSAGRKVRETQTTYQLLYKPGATAPGEVKGLAFERYQHTAGWLFGLYTLQTDVNKVVDKETVITYDVHNAGRMSSENRQFVYDSLSHHFLSSMKSTTSDGVILTSYTRYPEDYGTIPGNADVASSMIGRLRTGNRKGIPVEQYITKQQPGGIEKVVGGSLTLFSDFGTDKALASKILTWRSANPVARSSFDSSYIHPTTGVFTLDAGYQAVNTFLAYDTFDIPVHMVGEGRIEATTLWSSKLYAPVASVIDAKPGQFAFSDFEAATEASFNMVDNFPEEPGVSHSIGGRSGAYGSVIEFKFNKVLNKADASNFWLSGWWNRTAQSLVVKVQIKNAAKTVSHPLQTYTLPRTTTDAGWDFYKIKIPVVETGSSFYAEITFESVGFSGSIPTKIDDLALYPEHSVLSSTTYDFPYGVNSTSTDDRTGHTVYDSLGRVKYIIDRDGNIVQKNTYQFTQQN
jgi:hypothetical protein